MSVPVTCPSCNTLSTISDDFIGRKIRCKNCGLESHAAPKPPPTLGRYHVKEQVRQASFGPVYHAHDPVRNQDVQVVLLRPETTASPNTPRRLTQRVVAAAGVTHPNVVTYHVASADGPNYLVTSAWTTGRHLGWLLTKEGLEPRRAVHLATQVLDALAAAHQAGVVHGGLKPVSVLVDTRDQVHLSDLGLPGWDAPAGTPEPTAATDTYAVAVLMFQMLTGKKPFEQPGATRTGVPPSAATLRPDLSAELDAILARALHPNPAHRFASAAEFATALRGWRGGAGRAPSTMHAIEVPTQDAPPGYHPAQNTMAPAPDYNPFADLQPTTPPLPARPASRVTTVPAPLQSVVPAGSGTIPVPSSLGEIPLDQALAGPPPHRTVAFACALAAVFILLSSAGLGAWNLTRPTPTPAPAKGADNLWAGIEIGSKGVKFVVAAVRRDAELGFDFERIWPPIAHNTNISTGLSKEGRFDPEALSDTIKAVGSFQRLATDEYGVPPERLRIVASSGVLSSLQGKPDLLEENRRTLTAAVQVATGKSLHFVSVKEETELGRNFVVPPRYSALAVSVDVGNGGTRFAYREDGGRDVEAASKYGLQKFHEAVVQEAGDDAVAQVAAAERLREQLVEPEFRQLSERRPGLVNRERVYLQGGIVWALATTLHPEAAEPYVELSANDFETFHARLKQSGGKLPLPSLDTIPEGMRAEVEKELKKIGDVFTSSHLLAGAELLRGLARAYGFERGRKLYFPRASLTAWMLSYLGEEATKEPTK